MLVAVDEAGKDVKAGDIDDPSSDGRRQLRRRRDGLDPLAANENRHVPPLGRSRPIDQRRSPIEDRARVGGAHGESASAGEDKRDSAGGEEPMLAGFTRHETAAYCDARFDGIFDEDHFRR
jgi:hypothetical protein